MKHLEEFTAACFEALDFTNAGLGSGDECSGSPLSEELTERLKADCHSFWARCWFYVENTDMTPAQAGHDFWMTRNGHGVGFWDGDWDHTPYAELLDRLSKCYDELHVYLGDDGFVYA